MIGRIVIGLILIAVGTLIVKKSEWMLNNFGSIPIFDRFLHTSGGSRFGYKLIGLILIFIGILVTTNMAGGFIRWVLSPLLKYGGAPE